MHQLTTVDYIFYSLLAIATLLVVFKFVYQWAQSQTIEKEEKYWLLTVKLDGNFTTWTVLDVAPSPANFIMVSRSLGRKIDLVYALELTEEEYHLVRPTFQKEIADVVNH